GGGADAVPAAGRAHDQDRRVHAEPRSLRHRARGAQQQDLGARRGAQGRPLRDHPARDGAGRGGPRRRLQRLRPAHEGRDHAARRERDQADPGQLQQDRRRGRRQHPAPARRHRGRAVNLAALSAIWARRKYLALGVLAATLAAALTIAVAIPGIYRSTATVLVARPEMTTPSVRSPLTGELEARLNRIGEEILSRSRLEALLDRFDIYGPNAKADLEASVTRLRRDIRVDTKAVDLGTQGRGSTVAFAVSFRGRDPETVAQVANELAAYYVAENSTIRERRAAEAVQDIKREVDDAQKRLDEQDKRTNDFKRRNMGQLPEQVAANLAMLARLNAQLAELGPSPAKAGAAAPKPSRDLGDTEITALKAEDERLRRMIAAYQSRVEMAPEREQELQQLSRDYRATREMYDAVLKRYHDAQAAVDVERRRAGEEFQILERAVPAREPSAPNRAKLILLGVVLACAVTGAAVMLAE